MAKVGDYIYIEQMDGEPQYTGRKGTITWIDSAGQLHGTWGSLAVLPDTDNFTIIAEKK